MKRISHSGLTLIEVLLTMAITAMALAALSQLQHNGARAATGAALVAEASVLCQSELDAWLAGNRTSSALDTLESLPTSDGWTRRYTLQPVTQARTFGGESGHDTDGSNNSGLSLLTVEIYRGRQSQPEATLSRWIATHNRGGKP